MCSSTFFFSSEKLADKLQKELGTPFSREARGELRQWLNSYNKGTQPYFLRITYTPGRRGTKTKKGFAAKIQWTPTSVDNPVTMAGNSKKGKEPVTTLEEIYLKENLGELDSKYGTVLHIDHISMKNRAGHWKDYELSSIRKDKPGVYKDTLDKNILKKEMEIITIDGPSGVGKGTLALYLADKLDFNYLNSGALYRSIGYIADLKSIDLTDEALVAEYNTTGKKTELIIVLPKNSDDKRLKTVAKGSSRGKSINNLSITCITNNDLPSTSLTLYSPLPGTPKG